MFCTSYLEVQELYNRERKNRSKGCDIQVVKPQVGILNLAICRRVVCMWAAKRVYLLVVLEEF